MIIVSPKILKFFGKIFGFVPSAMAIFPFIILTDKEQKKDQRLITHERIHLFQQLELLVIPFYIWYLIAFYRKGYMNISFEKEAYANDHKYHYPGCRGMYSFLKYL